MQKDLIERLKENGILEIKYGKGKNQRTVPLEVYAAMVARTATREAYNVATLNQLIANGFDLVEMDTHTPTCAVCATYQGRVYSISGNDKRFPPLSRAFHDGFHNIHPNCRHTIGGWIESMHTPEEIEAAIKRSNEPFTDNRSNEDREYYNRLQRQAQQARQNQYQYERYKQRLGEDAPKSIGAFNRLKKAGGKKWEDLQEQYINAGKELTNETNRAILKAKIESGEITLVLNPEKQNPHIIGAKEYIPADNKSCFTISADELQTIVNANYGTGTVYISKGGQIKETLVVDTDIGFDVNPKNGNKSSTNRFTVHYSETRTHAVPSRKED